MTTRVLLLCALALTTVPAVLAQCVDLKSESKCQKVKADPDSGCQSEKGEKQCQRSCAYCCRDRPRRKLSPRKLSPLFGTVARTQVGSKEIDLGVEETDVKPFCDELGPDGFPAPAPTPVPDPIPAGETDFFSKVPEGSFPDPKAAITAKTSLNWKHKNLYDDDMTYVAYLMTDGDPPPMANTVNLGLEGNYIGDAGLSTFAGALSGLPNLAKLWLNKNYIGDDGLIAFADAIAIETDPRPLAKLTFLDLKGATSNTYTFTGLKALSTAVKNGALPNLEELRLDGGLVSRRLQLPEAQTDEIEADLGLWDDQSSPKKVDWSRI